MVIKWRRLAGTMPSLCADESVVPQSEVKALKVRVRELERLQGKKTMEAEILKEAIDISRENKLLSRSPSRKRDDSRSERSAPALRIVRSNLTLAGMRQG